MVRSMTAFAQASGPVTEGNWTVEIRSLNHKFFEFSLRCPPVLFPLESKIKALVQKELRRGKVTVNIGQDNPEDSGRSFKIDEETVQHYVNSARKLKKKFGVSGELSIDRLIQLPKVLCADKKPQNAGLAWKKAEKVLKQALTAGIKAKEIEGKKLAADVLKRLSLISGTVKKLEKISSSNLDRYWKRIRERLEQIIKDRELDEDRLYREAAMLAEKSDVTEEMVRLKSHVALFRSKLSSGGEVGRELDFMCQEMHREINTLGSKSQLFEISKDVVQVKRELEKIREQVQNIE